MTYRARATPPFRAVAATAGGMTRISRTQLAFSVAFLLAMPVAPGAMIIDPEPPMRWQELLDCELVILGHYAGHDRWTLVLEVDRVLRGKEAKKGDRLRVALRHWYSIRTGTVRPDAWRREAKGAPDEIPKLCYNQQVMNPGPLVPVRLVPDVRQPELYFFPKGLHPTLSRRGQVQPGRSADGWQQALDGKPMDLLFRLTQNANPGLAEQAVEELNTLRDPAVLDGLFQWLWRPTGAAPGYFRRNRAEQAERLLVAIGDREGDVYGRALSLLERGKQETPRPYQYRAARIMAESDPQGALDDFREMLAEKRGAPALAAAWVLGHIPTERALALSFDLLSSADYAQGACGSIRTLLAPAGVSVRPKLGQAQLAHLRQFAVPRLVRSLASDEVPEKVRKELRNTFTYRVPLVLELPDIDWHRAESVLMNPKDRAYTGLGSTGGAYRLYDDLVKVSDPKAVPLLVQVLCELPEARDRRSGAFREALFHYARLYPQAMRRELGNRGKLATFDPADTGSRCDLWEKLDTAVRAPRGLQSLRDIFREPGGREWVRHYPDRRQFTQAASNSLDYALSRKNPCPSLTDLEILWGLDRKACGAYVDRFLTHPDARQEDSGWSGLLALGIRCGRTELVGELVERVRKDVEGGRLGPDYYRAAPLLRSGAPKAYQEFLRILDEAPKARVRSNRVFSGPFAELLPKLMFDHPMDFFTRVEPMLRSDVSAERCAAHRLLGRFLYWDFEYDPTALRPEREKALPQLCARLRQLSALDEPQMRVAVLAMCGLALPDEPSRDWLPVLIDAAAGEHPALAGNALELIGTIVGDSPIFLRRRSPVERRPAIDAFLADRRASPPF